jgi:hypothetical protein
MAVQLNHDGFKCVRFAQANQVLPPGVKSMLPCLCVPPSQSITPGKPIHALVFTVSLMTGGAALVSIGLYVHQAVIAKNGALTSFLPG